MEGKMARELSFNEKLLISKVDMTDYYEKHIMPLNPKRFRIVKGSKITAICPFHTDTDPSMHFWEIGGIPLFKCFGCGVAGSVIQMHTLTERMYNKNPMNKKDAILSLAKLYGIEIQEEDSETIQSVFDRARASLGDSTQYIIPKGEFSLAEFRQLNNRIRMYDVSLDAKVSNYEQIDLVAAVSLSNRE